ncbi:ogr/Delta-like zinc finger family protein [Salmonella enterica]|uniref:Late control protein B n=2 Tax=Salmonella enterica TaxID=28901 RepID=A0A505CLE1_SALER|nr:ogr/Delta-like zinc finger family protein [Salmonella enterica]EAA6373969.1 late control protein B [Salmonella enterica subsp. enterica serovar Thompson]EBU8846307.1 late control protein B [Salmonella enterica subsp. enterica serovar Muenchen]ECH8733988.1 late control protein B [Salmonella enterica subsp. enterica serovar Wandsworth]ECU8746574.1 late control protein B [Salmonella enterica subsp. diarizonae str. CFSAN000558]EDV5349906.1 late control protein B [Salmonella enterica subsp. hout
MMICPLCGHVGHVRSSFRIPKTNVVERYMVCTNINCGHTFITHESFTRSIMRPGTIDPVTPHPGTGKPQLDLLAGLQAEGQPDANNNHP